MSISFNQAINAMRKYKAYLLHAKVVSEVNPTISKYISYFAYNKINQLLDLLNQADKSQFERILAENGLMNISYKPVTIEHDLFMEFLNNLFSKVDQEERENNTAIELAALFRLLADLIEILAYHGNLSPEWIVKSN
jgi:allophanate hydrolase subunit 1